jgi:hypothetical protein
MYYTDILFTIAIDLAILIWLGFQDAKEKKVSVPILMLLFLVNLYAFFFFELIPYLAMALAFVAAMAMGHLKFQVADFYAIICIVMGFPFAGIGALGVTILMLSLFKKQKLKPVFTFYAIGFFLSSIIYLILLQYPQFMYLQL